MSESEESNGSNNVSSASEDEETQEIDGEEREKIKQRLTEMSFEDLLKLKQEMGTKLYDKTVFGKTETKAKTSFKRANKNRPREMSSKIRIKDSNHFPSVKKQISRDPRFEPMCGDFDKKHFQKNYKFVNEIRKDEKKKLEEELTTTTDPEEKKKIKFVLQRLNNQIHEDEVKKHQHEQEQHEKTELQMQRKEGKKIVYKKKSVKKLESLIEKYENLKKSNQLQKHLEKKSKKIAGKERRHLQRTNLLTK